MNKKLLILFIALILTIVLIGAQCSLLKEKVEEDINGNNSEQETGEEEDPMEALCINAGGEVKTALCCKSAGDFPDTCLVGACGCSPENSHEVKVCDCGPELCFDGEKCSNIGRMIQGDE